MKIASNRDRSAPSPALQTMTLGALGIVFGDIGTSPLYTFKTVLALSGGKLDQTVVLGILSLLIWTLILRCLIMKQRHRHAIASLGRSLGRMAQEYCR